MRIRRILLPVAAIAMAAMPVARSEGLPDLGESAQADLSPQMEKRIGESIMRDIRLREPTYIDDPEVSGYLNRIGRKLASQAEDGRLDFEFFALRDATLNAFALPGGYIGVHSGLVIASQSESELASVLAHEISHVTQRHLARMVNKQSQGQMASLLAIAVAVLAARSNPDVAVGAALAGQGAAIQAQLNYSRDFEREADRLGLQLLERSGFDIRDMGAFFERLQKFGRVYENNAPAYLRTHPLTTERISDMGNRIQLRPYRQASDSLDFLLVRAKLKAQDGTPDEAIAHFESLLKERKFNSEPAARYGLAVAYMRTGDLAGAEAQIAALRKLRVASPMVETLAAGHRMRQHDPAGAVRVLRDAASRYPDDRAIAYALVEGLLADRRAHEALAVVSSDVQNYPSDARMRGLQAKTYAFLGKRLREHWAQAEAYALQGLFLPAIEQLQLAQKAPDGDFYERSQVDARLREIKASYAEEQKRRKP